MASNNYGSSSFGAVNSRNRENGSLCSSFNGVTPSSSRNCKTPARTVSGEGDSDDDIELIELSEEESEEPSSSNWSKESSLPSAPQSSTGSDDVSSKPDNEPDSESEPENEDWEVITIDDDNDDMTSRKAPDKLICLRCPVKKDGTFTDVTKFWIHVDRHVIDDHYSCVTCKRPFVKLNHCLSHEYRVHGTPIPRCYNNDRDKVIAKAKEHVSNLQKTETEQGTSESAKIMDIDPEDVMFYENRIHCSASYYPYRGPPVETMLECYEIQFYAKPKFSRLSTFARIALDYHRDNVIRGNDNYKLGKFGGPKSYRGFPGPAAPVRVAKKTSVKSGAKVASKKRSRDVDSDTGEKVKPKKRTRFISFSSDEDKEYVPEAKSEKIKERRISGTKRKQDEEPEPGPSRKKSNVNEAGPSKNSLDPVPGPSGVKKTKKPVKLNAKQNSVNGKKKLVNGLLAFPTALLENKCLKCNFIWKEQEDMRKHRDEFHPKLTLLELMTCKVDGYYEETKTEKKAKSTQKRKRPNLRGRKEP